ncbi:MAG: glycine cleavage system aminomethyltransferase GcvT, partial [Candidatus Gastranaerophilales bacterium]|nr:glycine cleavage system aminomethyltransferase GcvT [Candidatus Gastranaerophilales bacterium]
GWDMPIQYKSIIDEHKCVRTQVGLFDVSHMGEVFLEGEDAVELLQKLVPQNVYELSDKQIMYAQLTNKNGGIIDDLLIYKYEDNKYFVVINASRVNVDIPWIKENAKEERFNVKITDITNDYSLLALQGPNASALMDKIGIKEDVQPKYYSFDEFELLNTKVMIARTGYTGEDGFEILIKNELACELWDLLINEGQEFGILPIGLGARDTLRLEAAMLLYGQDMNEEMTPIQATLGWSVSKNKTHDYNGKSVINEQLLNKPDKKIVGFVMMDRGIARHGYEIYKNDQKIGIVTSGGISPTLNENIGLAYIDSSYKIEDEIYVKIRDKFYMAKIVKRPFVEKVNKIVR